MKAKYERAPEIRVPGETTDGRSDIRATVPDVEPARTRSHARVQHGSASSILKCPPDEDECRNRDLGADARGVARKGSRSQRYRDHAARPSMAAGLWLPERLPFIQLRDPQRRTRRRGRALPDRPRSAPRRAQCNACSPRKNFSGVVDGKRAQGNAHSPDSRLDIRRGQRIGRLTSPEPLEDEAIENHDQPLRLQNSLAHAQQNLAEPLNRCGRGLGPYR